MQYSQWDNNLYRMLSDANTTKGNVECSSQNVYHAFNIFGHNLCVFSYLSKCDLLHTMQIRMLAQRQMWMFHFMMTYKMARPVQCNLVICSC
jgi:hypothetical protein